MSRRKNLIVFYVDQQRPDHLGCYGDPVARTPHIDALAARGVRFDNHCAGNTVCMPSRASFFTGQHVLSHRLLDNGVPLPRETETFPEILTREGYRTHSIGKIHLTPYLAADRYRMEESTASWQAGRWDDWYGPYFGFQNVELTIGHGDTAFACGGHYGRWVREKMGSLDELAKQVDESHKENPFRSGIPLEVYHSTWVADRAVAAVEQYAAGDDPYMMFVSFPDPHFPFTPPEPYADMFDGVDFPPPHVRPGENDAKPGHWAEAMGGPQMAARTGAHDPKWTPEQWRQVTAATYAMNTLIDDSIGRVMAALEAAGQLDDTIIVYTGDHGEFLGDHGLLYKGYYPCRTLLNVPFIVAEPGGTAGVCETVMGNVDAAPTLLEMLGIPAGPAMQGRSYAGAIRGGAAPADPFALSCGCSQIDPIYHYLSLRDARWRLSYYPNRDDGELYDLAADPWELNNLYHDPAHCATRDVLMVELFKRIGRAEPKSPGNICPA